MLFNKYMVHVTIKRKIYLAQEYLEKVIPYSELSVKELLNNEEKLFAMERVFLLMVDEVIDINSALVYQIGGRIAEDNKSTFYELVSLGIINQEFADKITDSVKVRNQLTHDYEKKQKSAVIADMKKFVEIYKDYIKILIEKFITKE